LLTQNVLNQKWAILYLLYRLSGTDEVESPSLDPADYRSSGIDHRATSAMSEALAYNGLQKLSLQDDTRHNKGTRSNPRPYSNRSSELPNKINELEPSETSLLRDLPFTLQGLASSTMQFPLIDRLTLPTSLPTPIISLLHTLSEPALLYRNLSAFVQSDDGGLVGQSLRSAISEELRAYLTLVATLEGEIRRSLNDSESHRAATVTLKRCVVWTREATLGLRLMNLIVDEAKGKKGGQLISMIHSFSTSHGDKFVRAFADRMLEHVTRPFYDMLRLWVYDGELSDPYLEFFVIEQTPGVDGDSIPDGRGRGGASSVWENKYKLSEESIPTIITDGFAKKVFLIGKSLNFIRYGCGDSGWVESYSKSASKELRYGDTTTLEASIDEAYKSTMARLIFLMSDKFELFEHLHALKKYLLLGQGDFIALLMESLSDSLDRPANSLYRHNLTAQLEHAIRGSNAQFDSPEVLKRLDARMLELSHGEIGWDVFTLEYKIDAPVDVVVTPYGSRQYLKVFNFLWRIKRVEFALGRVWKNYMTGTRGSLSSVADWPEWKVARCSVSEMIHFIGQLQYYILFEVIESSWDALQADISKSDCTLDDLIEAHAKYLRSITHKGLLGAPKSSTGHKEDSFLAQLHEILKIMLAYTEAVDGLYRYCAVEFSRKQMLNAKIETRTAAGKWGLTEQDGLDEDLRTPSSLADGRGSDAEQSGTPLLGNLNDDHTLSNLRQRMQTLSTDFRARVNVLLGDLAHQPDVDMRFLGVVMNFNDVYHPIKRKPGRTQKEKKTPNSTTGPATTPNNQT
jgi:gamma-tubulin complex component 3